MMADYENSNQIILFASKVMYKLSEEEEEEKDCWKTQSIVIKKMFHLRHMLHAKSPTLF